MSKILQRGEYLGDMDNKIMKIVKIKEKPSKIFKEVIKAKIILN